MKYDFYKYKFSEIGEVIAGGTPKTAVTEYWDGGIAWITPKDLSNYNQRYISKGERSITTEGLKNSSAKLMPKNSILFTSRAPIGYIAIANNDISTNQGFKSIVCNEEKCHYMYLYYWLKNNVEMIKSRSNGSTFQEVSGSVMKSINIELPEVKVQKKVAFILNSIDNKIEQSNEISENLKSLSQLLFKHWFVDFEFPNEEGLPYKSSGGETVDSELGMIPNGWEVKKMHEVIDVRDGTHASPKPQQNGYPLVTSKHLSSAGIDFLNANLISKVDYDEINKRSKVNTGDILITMIGTVGNIYRVDEKKMNFAIKNVGLFRTSDNMRLADYIYLYLQSDNIKRYVVERLAGSTQQYISLTELRKIPVIIPNEVLDKFNELIKSIMGIITTIKEENRILSALHNTLLPKLMNGEIDLNNLEVTY